MYITCYGVIVRKLREQLFPFCHSKHNPLKPTFTYMYSIIPKCCLLFTLVPPLTLSVLAFSTFKLVFNPNTT